MAKVNAPLMSFGASGAIGKTMVYQNWKGLNVVRSFVIPANPKTTAQSTQRGYITTVVALIHTALALAADALAAADIAAYNLLASTHNTPRTWFNEICAQGVNQLKATLQVGIFRAGSATPGSAQVALSVMWSKTGTNDITAGTWYYGTSKTALINSESAAVAAGAATATVTGLAAGVKYYFQFRPSAHADYVGAASGIYYATPTT